MFELDPCVFRGKAPIDGLIGLVPGLRPCLDFRSDRREIR